MPQDIYQRRIQALYGGTKSRRSGRGTGKDGGGKEVTGSSRAVLHMVVAGEARIFREVESYTPEPIAEVPVRVSDMLAG